ncbi:MAG: hydroxyacid dehydrogenase [Candidatus Eisenbacteria bacterium]|nr:hydroxyacid dehydrogenase [Candidatus Eisenbacteria bacterium]
MVGSAVMPALWAHLLGAYDEDSLATLERALDPAVRISHGPELPAQPAFDLLVAGRPSTEALASSPRLRTLLIPYAGLPERTRTLLRERPQIAVHNLHHNAGAAAELAAALLLCAAKFLVPLDRALRAGDWSPRYRPNPSLLLGGKRAVVLGYGAIGRRVAAFCCGLDMEVAAIRRRPAPAPATSSVSVHGPEALSDLLTDATAVVVALPLTEKTRGLLGETALACLPRESVVVNVGRGAVIDETALFTRLQDGRIRAAGLDVWYCYPKSEAQRTCTRPGTLPFEELENVVLSPHRGGALGMAEAERARMRALATSLNAAARGEEIPHRVDVAEGY